MKTEYKKSPTDDLLLEAFYHNHLVNTFDIILREQVKEEESSISKEQNECHPNQHQIYNEEWGHSEEDHDSQINEESTSNFWVLDWGIGYDYKN